MNGKIIGFAKLVGNEYVYTNEKNSRAGSLAKIGNRWQFRDAASRILGYVEESGGRHVYKKANGSIDGYAVPIGLRTKYKQANGSSIGSADTNKMPFRPIPLAQHAEPKTNKQCKVKKLHCSSLTHSSKKKP